MRTSTCNRLALLALAAAVGALSACAGMKTASKKKTGSAGSADGADGLEGASTPGVEVGEMDLRGSAFQALSDLKTINFDYDIYALSDASRAALRENADYLKAHQDLQVLVEGHCDDRGTVQYNLALGQKRAKEVRDYYLRLGISAKSVATLSYGEEKPLCADASDDCWLRNRRAETKVRTRVADATKKSGGKKR